MPDLLLPKELPPDFTLSSSLGGEVSLSDFRGKTPVLIFFYPGDFTPVCTAEVSAFRDDYEKFRERGIELVGISPDKLERHVEFAKAHNIPFHLLSDPALTVATAFGARGLLGIRRAYFLLDREGALVWQHSELLSIFKMRNADLLGIIEGAL